ncbi:MAG TPA: 16S rRNA (cytidine(1402)-2'-O)-methyltransferase [Candidatus Paceibacterota bacterium]|nr:16S rRNA (cytidine(1402)-2'-O)-methyltransferase [Candidatus Paceibacterota bacterium]
MTLNVVATPIGNLGDLSPRAKEVLEKATLVIAEDTRMAKKLFLLTGIGGEKASLMAGPQSREFVSSHAQSSAKSRESAISRCKEHEHIVLVTDAGTPAISDPGSLFIDEFRRVYPDAKVVPIPGPSAAIAALSVSGFPSSHFEFLGFIPHKKGREKLFTYIAHTSHTIVFYESPHRILKTLEALSGVLGDRVIMVGREMTKQFEEYPRGTARELYDYYKNNPDTVRGEFSVVIGSTHKKSSDLVY